MPTLTQMTADAFTFHGAGTDTTAHTLTTATWQLINNPQCAERLRKELQEAIPKAQSDKLVSSNVLENLPYLVRNEHPRDAIAGILTLTCYLACCGERGTENEYGCPWKVSPIYSRCSRETRGGLGLTQHAKLVGWPV